MSELPLNDKPPRVAITNQKTIASAHHMQGVYSAIEVIDELKVPMPGVKLARAAIEAQFAQEKCRLLARLHQTAAKASVDFTRWVVAGIRFDGGDMLLDFIALEDIDKET